MRLSCPSCQTEYDVPDAALTGRTRKLRCVNCGNQWEAGPIGVADAAPEPAPTPADLEYMQRPRTAPLPGMTYGAAETPERRDFSPEFGNDYAPPPPASRTVELPARIDPAEARHQADRESFAALLEASRQPGSQSADAGFKAAKQTTRKSASPWLISFLILLLVAGLVFLERDHIMAAWPPSIRFFAAIGLR